jgi:RNA polymerase sigma factor (TIGR02999 family)
MEPPGEVTQLLNAWSRGDAKALESLAPMVESELRKVARAYLSSEEPGNTLQPTALINEAYLRLIEWKAMEWQGRAHFYAVAAKLMRRILVNHAESRGAQKRGGSALQVSLMEAAGVEQAPSVDMLALNSALEKLARFDARKSQLVELRFFGGLSNEEAAEVLGASPRTLNREWNLARAWLFQQLRSKA